MPIVICPVVFFLFPDELCFVFIRLSFPPGELLILFFRILNVQSTICAFFARVAVQQIGDELIQFVYARHFPSDRRAGRDRNVQRVEFRRV